MSIPPGLDRERVWWIRSGEAVRGDAPRQVHADRRDLAVLHPHARVVAPVGLAGAGLDARLPQRRHDRALHRAQEDQDVVDAHYRVADQLARTVVGELAAAVGGDDVDALLG